MARRNPFLFLLPRDGTRRARHAAALLALAVASAPAAAVESTLNEFWPELDVFVRLDERTRLFLLAAITRAAETGTSTERTLGAHLDWFPAGLPPRLLEIAPGMEGRWSVWTRVGYNHISTTSATSSSEERLLVEATLRSEPLWGGVRLANRSRVDLRWVGDDSSWRYRNRSRIERTWLLRERGGPIDTLLSPLPPGLFSAATPYAMLEFFWDRSRAEWSRRFSQIGVEFDLAADRTIEVYIARQDDLRQAGSTLRVGGVALTLRF
jgi:hypothetical protein